MYVKNVRHLTVAKTFSAISDLQTKHQLSMDGDTSNRRIFAYTFCLINISLPLSDDANKVKTLTIERA